MKECPYSCQAEIHVPACECRGCQKIKPNCRFATDDHFTGRAIGKALGWKKSQIERKENHQWLSPSCHKEKDRLTNDVLEQLRWQKKGGFIAFGHHVLIGVNQRR